MVLEGLSAEDPALGKLLGVVGAPGSLAAQLLVDVEQAGGGGVGVHGAGGELLGVEDHVERDVGIRGVVVVGKAAGRLVHEGEAVHAAVAEGCAEVRGVLAHKALAAAVDPHEAAGLHRGTVVAEAGAVVAGGHKADAVGVEHVHVPHLGADLHAHAHAVAGVVDPALVGQGRRHQVVADHLVVVLEAAAAQDDAPARLDGDLAAVGMRGAHADDGLGLGVLHQVLGAGVEEHLDVVLVHELDRPAPEGAARGLALELGAQRGGAEAVGAGPVAVVGAQDAGEVAVGDAAVVEPLLDRAALLHVLLPHRVVGEALDLVVQVGEDLLGVLDGRDAAGGDAGGSAALLGGLLEHDDLGAVLDRGGGGHGSGPAEAHDHDVGLVVPGWNRGLAGHSRRDAGGRGGDGGRGGALYEVPARNRLHGGAPLGLAGVRRGVRRVLLCRGYGPSVGRRGRVRVA